MGRSVSVRTEFLDSDDPARADCDGCHRSRSVYLLTYRIFILATGATLAMGVATYCPYCDPQKSELGKYLRGGS